MSAKLLIPIAAASVAFGFFYLFSYLSGWHALARVWPTQRSTAGGSAEAFFAEVDWSWCYRWWIKVRILDRGIHCQPVRFFIPLLFHPPLLVPWADIIEVKPWKYWQGDAIEVRASAAGYAFRICYPVRLGFPAEHWPNKALEPTTTSVTSPAAQEPRQP